MAIHELSPREQSMLLFSDRLVGRMEALGLTTKTLAQLSGVSEGAISYYRRAHNEAGVYNIVRLAKALRCSTDYLLGVEGPDPIIVDARDTAAKLSKAAEQLANIAQAHERSLR